MTILTKADGSETKSIQEIMQVMLEYVFKEDSEEENSHQKQLRKTIEELTKTSDDVEL